MLRASGLAQPDGTDALVQNAPRHYTEILGLASPPVSSAPSKMPDSASTETKIRIQGLSAHDVCSLIHGFDSHCSFDYTSALRLLLGHPSLLPRVFSECPSLSDTIVEALRKLDIDDLYARDSSKAAVYVVFKIAMVCGLGLESNQDTIDGFLSKSLSSLLDAEEVDSVSAFYQPLFTRLMQSMDVDEPKCTTVRDCLLA